jgi:hypothetical protein
MPDWIPRNEQGLIDLMARWDTYLGDAAKKTAFGWDTAACGAVALKMLDFSSAREEYEGDKTKEKRLAKDEAKEAAIKAMRDFANTSIRFNKKMTDADKLFMGISPRDSTYTPPATPETWPVCEVELPATGEVLVKYTDSGTGKKARPHGVRGAEFVLVIRAPGDPAPAADEDFIVSEFSDVSPKEIKRNLSDRGKMLYFRTRWEVSEAKKGPWSPVYSTVIP